MTLLASERSLLIRSKFRSVLQLRIQNRRQSEINADPGLKSASPPQKPEKERPEALRRTDNGAAQKLPSSGLNPETAQERTVCGGQRQKKARHSQDLGERIPHLPGPVEHKQLLSLESGSASESTDVLKDDIASSPAEQRAFPKLPGFSPLAGLSGDQLRSEFSAVGPSLNHRPAPAQSGLTSLSATESIRQPLSVTLGDSNSMATTGRPNGSYMTSQNTLLLPKTARPPSPGYSSSLPTALNFSHLSRPRKPRDAKPKVKKLKYHQYIPPDQRGGSGNAGGGAKQKSPTANQYIDPASSSILKQQQVFLQLQILQNHQQLHQQLQPQQQITVVTSGDHSDLLKSSGAMPINLQHVPNTANQTSMDANPVPKSELLPADLDDLTVSELRQQLRKRGLPVSGTKPALLQRLRLFQLPRSCVTPAPLCQLGSSLEAVIPLTPLLPSSQSPSSSSSSRMDSPGSSPSQQMFITDRGIPNGILTDSPNGVPEGMLLSSGFSQAVPVTLSGDGGGLTNAVFLAPANTASGTPSPSLPMSCSSPLSCTTPLRSEMEQQREPSVEKKERLRSRSRNCALSPGDELCGNSLHPFLQQDPGCSKSKPEAEVYGGQPCDLIGQDFELPVQITASPVQALPCGIRSLEEELQEAIQKAQMDPAQSIDDILDEPLICVNYSPSDRKSPADSILTTSPLPPSLPAESQAPQQQNKDNNFLPSPLCSSLLLELPPSPAVINPSQVFPVPPPPPICTSPLPSTGPSRKRRAAALFDAAEWLETLTSGLRPLTPPVAPFVEQDFSLDSDLNVSRVLDLLIEKW
ncbi:myocardin isoform X2 [Takifugu flavidus]|uniref:myocardin isoform X2 n=1 Tax=Takifugu flavidus TaxID=433684 RepID=UPI00254442FC|nr:myocardin isoform X2 [Takifugu flavidus]